jgi:hypothetical protein
MEMPGLGVNCGVFRIPSAQFDNRGDCRCMAQIIGVRQPAQEARIDEQPHQS